jgi:hypothetical protein
MQSGREADHQTEAVPQTMNERCRSWMELLQVVVYAPG